jgi:rod shape-determining protein MreD
MKIIKPFLLVLSVFIFQTVFSDLIAIKGRKPDFLLITLIFLSFGYGNVIGTTSGFFIGLLQDVIETQFIGINALTKSIIGFVAGYFITKQKQKPEFGLIFFFCAFLHDVIFYYIFTYNTEIKFFNVIMLYALPNTLYSLVIAMLIFLIISEGKKES